jgi:putative membrane protein
MFGGKTRKWVQASLMLCMGLYLLDNLLTGQIFYYINERFGWLMWVAAVLFLILGGYAAWELITQRRAEGSPSTTLAQQRYLNPRYQLEQTHGSRSATWPMLGVMLVPLVFGILVPARPLGAQALSNTNVNSTFGRTGSVTQLNMAPSERNILDWIRSFNALQRIDEANGQPADVVGFVYRDIRFEGKPQFMVVRYVVACCVADANAIGLIVETPESAKWQSDTWVRVTGKFQVKDVGGSRQPVLIAEKIEQTELPKHPYLYP